MPGAEASMSDPYEEIEAGLLRADYAGALKGCQAILARAPDDPGATFLLARILSSHGRGRDAFTLFDKAHHFGHPESETLAQQALCLIRNSQPDEALLFAERSIRLDPVHPEALHALGLVFSRTERHAEATPFYERAIAAAPHIAIYHHSLALNLQALGRTDASRAAFRACLDLDPGDFRALGAWAHITPLTASDIAQMEGLATRAETSPDPSALLRLGHALAKAYDDIGEPGPAIAWLKRGKARLRAEREDHDARDAALFDAAASALASPPAPGYSEVAPVFVVGLPRTGTTLLDRILSSHSQIDSVGESRAVTWTLRDLLQERAKVLLSAETLNAARSLDPRRIGETYCAHLGWSPDRKTRPVDMMPLNFFFVPLLQRALPEARFLCLRRSPADTVLNNFRHLLENRWGHYDYAYGLGSVTRYFVRFDRLMKACAQNLPAGRFCFVDYEALANNLEPSVHRILDFCGVPFEQACLDFHTNPNAVNTPSALQVRQPVHTGSIGRWRRYEPHIAEALDILTEAGLLPASERAPGP
jgi:tetratricopeptide (TPR) repeat protein